MVECKGIVRRVDELGRIVLPREMRKTLNIREGTRLEIGIVDGCKFLLSKYSQVASLKDCGEAVINAISNCVEHDILISDMDTILCSNKKKYVNKMLSDEVQDLIYGKEIILKKQVDDSQMLKFFNEENIFSCQLIVPIIKDGDAVGAIIVLCCENKCFDDSDIKVCRSFAKYLADQIS